MKKLPITKEELKRMQKMRDNKISTRDIGRIFGCSASFVCRHTENSKRLKTPEEQEAMFTAYLEHRARRAKKPNKSKVTRPRKEEDDFPREVRVLKQPPKDLNLPKPAAWW